MEKCEIKMMWVVNIWPKGQIVIPKEIREQLHIEQWDSLSILLKEGKYIWLVRNQDINDLMEYVKMEKN